MKKRTTVVAVIEIIFGAYLLVIGAFVGSIGAEVIIFSAIYVLAGVVFILAGVGLLKKSKFAWYFLTVLLAIGLLLSHPNILGQTLFGVIFFLPPLILLLTDPPKRWTGQKPG